MKTANTKGNLGRLCCDWCQMRHWHNLTDQLTRMDAEKANT